MAICLMTNFFNLYEIQIKELNLDNARSVSIVGLTDDYCNLESLSLINVGLSNLKGFPNLPKLRKLELSDNRISSGLNYLKGCLNLKTLNLCGNKVSDFEALEPLVSFNLFFSNHTMKLTFAFSFQITERF